MTTATENVMSRSTSVITHVTGPEDNLFADLGFAPDEAQRLLADADAMIDQKIEMKRMMMGQIADWMRNSDLTQAAAADILGISRPRVSDVVTQKHEKISLDCLVDLIFKTGHTVGLKVS